MVAAVLSPARNGKVIVHVPAALGSVGLAPVVIHLNVADDSPTLAKSLGIISMIPVVASVETSTVATVISPGEIEITSSDAVIAVVPV
jgi:hypothetical protein